MASGEFSEVLAQLQAAHDTQVASLAAEVVRLRAELEASKLPAQACLPSSKGTPNNRPNGGDAPHNLAVAEYWAKPLSNQDTGQVGGPGDTMTSTLSSKAAAPTYSRGRDVMAIRDILARPGYRGKFEAMLQHQAFDIFMGIVIAANAVIIGIESNIARNGEKAPPGFASVEYGFITVYMLELAIRLAVRGIRELANPWVRFDLFVVVCGIVDVATKVATAGARSILEMVLLVRILRLARLAKIFRMMTKFNTLWLLVNGLMNSFSTQVWTCVLVSILLYVFSVLGLEVLPDPHASDRYRDIVDENFSSLFKACVTLLQGLTMDSFSNIYRPIMLEKPYMAFYFVPFVLTVPIAFMNLVTAIMVNSSLDQAAKDKEAVEEMQMERREALASLLNDMFTDLDTNGSGRIDAAEMLNAPDEVHSLIFEIAEVKMREPDRRKQLEKIFRALDVDNSGDIEISEFCGGLTKMHNREALDTMRLQKKCANVMDKMTKVLSGPSKVNVAASGSGIQFV